MFSLILITACVGLFAAALFYFLRTNELSAQLRRAEEAWQLEAEAFASELAKLEKIRHIPDVIEKARLSKAHTEAKLAEAERRADEIISRALAEAQERGKQLRAEAEALRSEAAEALRVAKLQSQAVLEEAQKEAKELASKARKDAKEKREKTEAALEQAIDFALEIRQKAERRADDIAGEAYRAKGKLRDFEATAQALLNRIEKYEGVYVVPATHVLDGLAGDFGFQGVTAD